MSTEEVTKIAFDVPKSLANAIQEARNKYEKFKGERISNRIIYNIGARVFLGIGDKNEEILHQKIKEIEVQENIIHSHKNLLLEQLDRCEAEKKTNEAEVFKAKQDRELLASEIIAKWDKIALLNQKENINFICNLFPAKLSKDKVKAVFPEKYTQAPTLEKALLTAEDLLSRISIYI